MLHTWQIVYYLLNGGCETVEVVRKNRPTKLARALMRVDCQRFEIHQVV